MQVLLVDTSIEEYLLSMRREINVSDAYRRVIKGVLERFARFSDFEDWKQVTQKQIVSFLDTLRKPEPLDPLHKWIGSYNSYAVHLIRFFKWVYYPDVAPNERPKPECLDGISRLRRKEKSIYKPTDLWTTEDDLLFLKYCPSVRDKAYHMIARDSSCRPHEILKLKIKDIVFKLTGNKQYAEILVNGKTGSRHIPLINSIPYVKDWLDEHPQRTNPNIHLICSHKVNRKMNSNSFWMIYSRYKTEYFPQLLEDPRISPEDKNVIRELLKKPWNPYIRRHSALTDKSKILKENILRQHAGWSSISNMPQVYLHYFGNESSESILEAYGLKPKSEGIDKMQPVSCPNCGEGNKIDSKFCAKCRMVLSYDAYTETVEEKDTEVSELKLQMNDMRQTMDKILGLVQENPKLAKVKTEVLSDF